VLLTKLEYLALVKGAAAELTPEPEAIVRTLRYARKQWPALQLAPRTLAAKDLARTSRHGKRAAFHVRAFPRRMPEAFVIVVADLEAEQIAGHILIDLAAEQAPARLDSPSQHHDELATRADIRRLIPALDYTAADPFAVLAKADGTYLQTLRTRDGFALEYQLVNTSSHYETTRLVTVKEVVSAMISYGFEKQPWLDRFTWRRQEL